MTDTIDAEVCEEGSASLVITRMQPGLAIEGNFEAVKAHIETLVADYRDLVVTEAYLAQAKKDRAYLNSISTSLTQRFREVKRTYMAPVEALDRQIKELEAPIKEASAAIDAQVKAFEEQQRAEKRAALVEHYAEYAPILVDVVPFERIEDPAWLTKAVSLRRAFDAIEAIVDRIARDDATLDGLGLSHAVEAKATYLDTLDLSAAIARSKALEEQEERTRRFEEEKAAIAAARSAACEAQAPVEPAPDPVADEPAPPEEALVRERIFTVQATDAQVAGIIAYLKSVGITGTVTR